LEQEKLGSFKALGVHCSRYLMIMVLYDKIINLNAILDKSKKIHGKKIHETGCNNRLFNTSFLDLM